VFARATSSFWQNPSPKVASVASEMRPYKSVLVKNLTGLFIR
jgi:hypothetical protein